MPFQEPETRGGKRASVKQTIFENRVDDIATLQRIGITEAAITAYIDRVQEGSPRQRAIDALLQGRVFLSEGQKSLIRTILGRFPIP
jgi:hypothetical protein